MSTEILSDRGTEFTGKIWVELMNLLGVQQMLTSTYYPQGNGIIEHSHRIIHNLLRAHISSREDENWVDLLPRVMLTFNEMTQDQHGFTDISNSMGTRHEPPRGFDSRETS